MMTKKNQSFHDEDVKVALLEQSIVHIAGSLKDIKEELKSMNDKIERRFEQVDEKFERVDFKFDKMSEKFDKMNDKMDSHFRVTIYVMLGLYVSVIGSLFAALGKSYGWF